MNCEDYLLGYRRALEDMESLDYQIAQAESALQGASTRYDRIGGRGGTTRADQEARLADLMARRARRVEEARQVQADIDRFIQDVALDHPDGIRIRHVLHQYYVACMSIRDIAPELRPRQIRHGWESGVTFETVNRLRHRGLVEAQKLYDEINKG